MEDAVSVLPSAESEVPLVPRHRVRELLLDGQTDEELSTWAAAYEDDAPQLATHNRRRQEAWLVARTCSVLRLEGDLTVAERVAEVPAHSHRGEASAEERLRTTPASSR